MTSRHGAQSFAESDTLLDVHSSPTKAPSSTWQQSNGLFTWAVISTAGNIFALFVVLLGPSISDTLSTSLAVGSTSAASGNGITALAASTLQVDNGACVSPDYSLVGPDSDWYTLKLIPPPAPCPVQGMAIEMLEPQYNFRRPYTLGSWGLEAKWHLLPYLRAVQDRSMGTSRRRVLLDLGGKSFDSSTLWFLQVYPLAFTEVHTFEVNKGVFVKPTPAAPLPADLVGNLTQNSLIVGAGKLPVPKRNLDSITLHEKFVGTMDSQNAINITRFMLEELGLKRGDAVVVKMDIEQAEWGVLHEWMSIPEMPYIVDEIFVEVHYHHPSMTAFHWGQFKEPREKATELLQDMRDQGFFVHAWP